MLWRLDTVLQCVHDSPDITSEEGWGIEPEPRNLSHYQPMDPYVHCSKSKKRVKACGQALPTHD